MEALRSLIPLLITVSLAGLVLAVGLNAGRGDLLYVLRRPSQFLKAILAVIVIPPVAAAILIALMTPLEPVVKAGIMLMAISPVPPLVPGKELAVGGRKEYAYGLYAAMALLTVVSVPAVLAITTTLFGRHDFVSMDNVARTVGLGVLLPLGIGVAIREIAPVFAGRIWRLIYQLSMILVLLAFTPVVIQAWPAILDLIGNGTVLAMAAVTVIAIVSGHLLGGPDRRDRATLAMASAVRHPGIAMSIAGASFHDPRVSAAVLLFMLVGLVAAAPYSAWIKRGLHRPAHS
ncbi:MAG: bile acid:sodium symporter family protein [Vitreimonas sp.]